MVNVFIVWQMFIEISKKQLLGLLWAGQSRGKKTTSQAGDSFCGSFLCFFIMFSVYLSHLFLLVVFPMSSNSTMLVFQLNSILVLQSKLGACMLQENNFDVISSHCGLFLVKKYFPSQCYGHFQVLLGHILIIKYCYFYMIFIYLCIRSRKSMPPISFLRAYLVNIPLFNVPCWSLLLYTNVCFV